VAKIKAFRSWLLDVAHKHALPAGKSVDAAVRANSAKAEENLRSKKARANGPGF
jgi:hypothetical protein